jgi:adenylate cyclase
MRQPIPSHDPGVHSPAVGEGGTPIIWLLPLVLAGLVLGTVVPVVLLGYLGARENTTGLLRDRGELVLDVVVDRVAAHLDPVRALLAYAAEAVRRGALDPQDDVAMRAYIAGSLAAAPQINGISFVRPDQTVRRHNRSEHASYEETSAMLLAVQQSIADERTDSGLRWVGPLWSVSLRQPILAARVPLRGPADNDKGLLVATVSVAELSRSLAQITDDIDQTPFILAGREHVLAHPALVTPDMETKLGPGELLPPVGTFQDGVLARIWTREANSLSSQPFRQAQGHWSWFEADSFQANAYVYRTISDYGATPWIVGVHYSSAETRRERWIVLGIGIGGLVLLVIALGVAVYIARRLSKPVLALAEAAARVGSLDFAGARTLPRGPVREINQAAEAVERMAAGLTWFETYLPKTLVRRLMATGAGTSLTETREVTVMFTDLEHYSDYSSTHSAVEVTTYLNDLLARVGPIIEASGGTIDKYIGDSVMAFWGAPDDRPDHARAACRAACDIAGEVEALNAVRRAHGLHACRMRIGLHTGAVAVGNVGFAGRVDYTIIGRTVNIAQKLEQCGRQVASDGEAVILTSGATSTVAGPGFSFEGCQNLDVRGAGEIFRLMPMAPQQ